MMITRLDHEEKDDRQLIKSGGIRESATGLHSRLVERTKMCACVYVYSERCGTKATAAAYETICMPK